MRIVYNQLPYQRFVLGILDNMKYELKIDEIKNFKIVYSFFGIKL